MVGNAKETGEEATKEVDLVALITTAVQLVGVTTKVPILETLNMATKILRPLLIEFRATIANVPGSSGLYPLIIQM